MKHLYKFSSFLIKEDIIDFKSENIENFYNTLKKELESGRRFVELDEVVRVGSENDIEIVTYEQFCLDLDEGHPKPPRPPHGMPFATINIKTKKIRVVLDRSVDRRLLEYIYHMIKHENIHLGQIARKHPILKGDMGDPTDRKKYFSDKEEVMAFSQSVSDMIISENPSSLEESIRMLRRNPLYQDIKSHVDNDTLKRYNKYIYLYLQKHFQETN